jgi:hypothetical protein
VNLESLGYEAHERVWCSGRKQEILILQNQKWKNVHVKDL